MSRSRTRRVLVSVLDWGLGHASRTSVVVRRLVERGDHVVLAGSGRSLDFLRAEFPLLVVESLPSFSPSLCPGRWLWLRIGLQVPCLLVSIWREHVLLDRLVRKHGIDLVLSDNRYGLWTSRCSSFIITHQLRPRLVSWSPRWMDSLAAHFLAVFLRKFTGVLVPDFRLGALSGGLSYPPLEGLRCRSIGMLSRLALVETADVGAPVAWLGIASGAEPQRSLFVEFLCRRFAHAEGRRVVVCGDVARTGVETRPDGVELWFAPSASQLRGLILSADGIVCRSGYSTLMDLVALGKQALLVPTEGQAEQEYLANHVSQQWEAWVPMS